MATLAGARLAFAEVNDAEATKLRQLAIEQDYLATDFAAAEKKLSQALTLCKSATDCKASTRARLHCDLGVVYFAQQKKDEADAQFAAALKEDPGVVIGPDLTSPEVKKELEEVKASAPVRPRPPAANADGGVASGPTPGQKKPPSSGSESDCPPGFPGCKTGAPASPTSCNTTDDCAGGESCHDGTCSPGEKPDESEAVPVKPNWLSVAVEQDFLILPSADRVCAGGSGYTCFENNGGYYKGTPLLVDSNGKSAGDAVGGGAQPATTRIVAGYDRAFGSNLTAGARVGFAVGGGPQRPDGASFFPVHIEARATYWFGRDALARKGVRFFALLAGGAAEVDASVTAYVYEASGTGNVSASPKAAWKKTGLGFAAFGVGAMYAFTPSSGIVLEGRLMQLFPTAGTAFGPQLAYTFGL